jgi:hypothetical protein
LTYNFLNINRIVFILKMDFFIKKGATYPYLTLDLDYKDEELYDRILNSRVTISIRETDGCTPIVLCENMELFEEDKCYDEDCYRKILISYKPTSRATSKIGNYLAEITIDFQDNGERLILPIQKKLYFNVV